MSEKSATPQLPEWAKKIKAMGAEADKETASKIKEMAKKAEEKYGPEWDKNPMKEELGEGGRRRRRKSTRKTRAKKRVTRKRGTRRNVA